jgi:hypothetical protein
MSGYSNFSIQSKTNPMPIQAKPIYFLARNPLAGASTKAFDSGRLMGEGDARK